MKVINFSHPLIETAQQQIMEQVGEELEIFTVKCQIEFDSDQSVESQINDIATEALTELGNTQEFLYVPPSLNYIAAYIAPMLLGGRMIVLRRDTFGFVLHEIIG